MVERFYNITVRTAVGNCNCDAIGSIFSGKYIFKYPCLVNV